MAYSAPSASRISGGKGKPPPVAPLRLARVERFREFGVGTYPSLPAIQGIGSTGNARQFLVVGRLLALPQAGGRGFIGGRSACGVSEVGDAGEDGAEPLAVLSVECCAFGLVKVPGVCGVVESNGQFGAVDRGLHDH